MTRSMFSKKSKSWRIRDKLRQDSSESTSTQASLSIREFELFREFCGTSDSLAEAAAVAGTSHSTPSASAAAAGRLYSSTAAIHEPRGVTASRSYASEVVSRSYASEFVTTSHSYDYLV